MREELFKMERKGLVTEGEEVKVTERVNGSLYSYLVEPSVAMSGIPGGGGTGELVLCTIFFPEQLAVAYPFALALGNLVDPPATMVNAAGDYVASYIVERFVNGKDWLQKKLNQK